MKSEPFIGMKYMQLATKVLATLFNIALLIAASIEIGRVFFGIYTLNIASAIQDGLFVLILLEMFYVVRSFIKYGSVNIALIISLGIVAVVKELIFNLKTLDLSSSGSYAILLLSLSIAFVLEDRSYTMKVLSGNKPRSIREEMDLESLSKLEEEAEMMIHLEK